MTSQEKEQCTEVQNIEFFNTQQCKFSVFTFISPQFKFSVHLCVLIKLCYIILSKISIFISCCPWTEACMILALTSHPFACFFISSYLLWTPDNLNFLQFPLKVQIIGSWRVSRFQFLQFDWMTSHMLMGWKLCSLRV